MEEREVIARVARSVVKLLCSKYVCVSACPKGRTMSTLNYCFVRRDDGNW